MANGHVTLMSKKVLFVNDYQNKVCKNFKRGLVYIDHSV
jgi:hypothetical protein